jgi:hypothetical protein
MKPSRSTATTYIKELTDQLFLLTSCPCPG